MTSISSKLAILGPPRLVVEVPEGDASALGLLRACGYQEEETLTDWRLESSAAVSGGEPKRLAEGTNSESLVIPVTAAELQANGLLLDPSPSPAWERTVPTLLALGERLSGNALALGERLAASILYMSPGPGGEGRILRLAASDPAGEGGGHLERLLRGALAAHPGGWIFPRALSSEPAAEALGRCGFTAGSRFLRMAAAAQAA